MYTGAAGREAYLIRQGIEDTPLLARAGLDALLLRGLTCCHAHPTDQPTQLVGIELCEQATNTPYF